MDIFVSFLSTLNLKANECPYVLLSAKKFDALRLRVPRDFGYIVAKSNDLSRTARKIIN